MKSYVKRVLVCIRKIWNSCFLKKERWQRKFMSWKSIDNNQQ